MHVTFGIEIGVAAVIVLILVVVFVAFVRRSKNVYGKLWTPLIPLVNGSAQGSRLTGTYAGMPVSARITGDGTENYYELTMTSGAAAGDWALAYTGEKFLGTGNKTWRVKSKDDSLRQSLTDAGAVTAIQSWANQPEITFKGKGGTLHYWQRVESLYDLPAPQQFQAHLDLLAHLATINRQVNVAETGPTQRTGL